MRQMAGGEARDRRPDLPGGCDTLGSAKAMLAMMCCLLRAAGEAKLYQEREDSAKMTGSRMAFASRG